MRRSGLAVLCAVAVLLAAAGSAGCANCQSYRHLEFVADGLPVTVVERGRSGGVSLFDAKPQPLLVHASVGDATVSIGLQEYRVIPAFKITASGKDAAPLKVALGEYPEEARSCFSAQPESGAPSFKFQFAWKEGLDAASKARCAPHRVLRVVVFDLEDREVGRIAIPFFMVRNGTVCGNSHY